MQIGGWEDQSDFVAMRRSSPIRGLLGLVYTFDRLVQCFEELGRLNPQGCDDFLYVDEGNVAPKLGGAGTLKYQLWVNDSGNLYVKITENSEGGTASSLLFSVAEYAPARNKSIDKPCGLDLARGAERKSGNNDDGGFLKAVLQHLLDGRAPT